jgi:hypothetical protein
MNGWLLCTIAAVALVLLFAGACMLAQVRNARRVDDDTPTAGQIKYAFKKRG